MDRRTPEEIAQREAIEERVRQMPGAIIHRSEKRVPFESDIHIVGHVDLDDILGYRGDEDKEFLDDGLKALTSWQASWSPFEQDATLNVPDSRMREVLTQLAARLQDNYPFFHPSYAGQMLKPPHEIAAIAYFLAQQINPNNHALDGGPATAKMEREVIGELAGMFGYDPAQTLGHLTSSGTIANLEALWVARELHPDRAIAYSAEAHYTHSRMCEVIGAHGVNIAADREGRMDLDDLRAKLATEQIGTVVATTGTTGLGAVDPVADLLDLQREHPFRIHVDAAYGGFYTLLAGEKDDALRPDDAAAFRAIAQCDSVVVDPHKHGLQPYGCGSVLFRDASVGRLYKHDSPYTYFTSDELHLGEISLECSRAGAAAAALWATLQCFPLQSSIGFGPILRKCREAALAWATLLKQSDRLRLILEPALDIVAFYPLPTNGDRRVSAISALTKQIFTAGMTDTQAPFYLATLTAKPDRLAGHDDLVWDEPAMTVFRSVLMKPEHLAAVPWLHERVLEMLHEVEQAARR